MKKRKGLVLCLCLAFLATATVGLATSCGEEKKPNGGQVENPIEYGEDGVYYCDTDQGEFLIDLNNAAFTWTFGKDVVSGTYTFDGRVLTFKADGGAQTTGTLKDGVLTLAYGEETFEFLIKKEYTVTFDVGGSAKVVNGRTVEKPTDPKKENQLFVGWYKDSGFKNKFDFSEAVKGDMTLYARFVEVGNTADEFTATLVVDGETFGTQQTVGGVLYNLPAPQKDGKKFAGWWVSHSGDAEKLTYKYEEQKIGQHETLFAVWETEAPLVSVNEKGVTWTAPGVGNSYTVKVTAPDGKDVSRTQGTTSYDYNFAGKAEGEYKVEVTVGDKTTTVYYMNKALAKVCLFSVEGNVLAWNAVEGAEDYLLTIECAEGSHNHVEQSSGGATTFDFANCGMKKGGLVFSVKAVAEGHVASVSEEFVIERNLAAAENVALDAAAKLTWTAVENAQSYTVNVNGDTYTTAETTFDVRNYTSNLTISVTPVAAGYNSPDEAPMSFKKDTLASPTDITLDATTIRWTEVAGANGYVVVVDGQEFSAASNSFNLTNEHYDETKPSCSISVRALGTTAETNSIDSVPVTINFGTMSDAPVYANGKVSWQPALNVSKFEVKVGNAAAVEVDADKTEYAVTFAAAGEQEISVRCFNKATGAPSAWVSVKVNVYKVTFEVEGGNALESAEKVQYKAKGDPLTVPQASRTGYTFDDWYNAKTDGAKLTGTTFENEVDTSYYAYWTANKYAVKLIATFQDQKIYEDEVEIAYDSNYNLGTINDLEDKAIYFGGWYTEPNAIGVRYTDVNGDSLKKWTRTEGITLYADWIEVLSYEKVKATNGVDDVYQVSKGADIGSVKEVVIPATFNGLPVATVAANAFDGCKSLEKISIPNTIVNIELSNGGNYTGSAFKGCTKLTYVDIYEVEGGVLPESYYEDVDGVIIYNNQYTGKELKYYPLGRGGDVIIPDDVTTLPANVFRGYTLKSITIPASVTNIDAGAFKNVQISKITFTAPAEGEEVKPLVIALGTFDGCDSLESITLPARLAEFSLDLFADCGNLKEIHFEEGNDHYSSKGGVLCNADGTEIIWAPKAFGGEYTIPDGVTSIGPRAFYGTKVTSLIVPGAVTNIGDEAFYNISTLTSVVFQGKATDPRINIGVNAFANTKLTSLTLPENTGIVSDGAFNYISGLTKVTVAAIVNGNDETEMALFGFGSGVFYYVTDLDIGVNCPAFDINGAFGAKLRRVTVLKGENGEKNPYIASDADGVLFNATFTEILYYPTSRPGNYVIPETVEVIGGSVFAEKLGLTQITIGWKVREIGKNAFADCDRLTTVIFEPTPEGETPVDLNILDGAFMNDYLENLQLPTRTRTIGAKAFRVMYIPNGFTIPEGVTSIGAEAFSGNVFAGVISLPSTLENMGENTNEKSDGGLYNFRSSGGEITKFVVAAGNPCYMSDEQGILYKKDEAGNPVALLRVPNIIDSVVIPATVTEIYPTAFYYSNVKSITCAPRETVKAVAMHSYVFYSLRQLTTLEIPVGVEECPSDMISTCPLVETFEVPHTVRMIFDAAFRFGSSSVMSALREVTFQTPENPSDIEEYIVGDSTSSSIFGTTSSTKGKNTYRFLKEITLPEGVTATYGAFVYMEHLEKVTLPSTLFELGGSDFRYCYNLKSVVFDNIEDSVLEYIGSYVFSETAITTITLPDGLLEFSTYVFKDCKKLVSVHSAVDADTVMEDTLPSGLEKIPNYLFQYATALKKITIPADVASIGNNSFDGAASLENVLFESGSALTKFGNYTFNNCFSLKEIEIPKNVTTFGTGDFWNCTALTSVTFEAGSKMKTFGAKSFMGTALKTFAFPESTNAITVGADMFMYCSNLESVHISSDVASIDGAFTQCAGLKTITVAEGNQNLVLGAELPIITNAAGETVRFVFKALETTDGVYTIPASLTTIGQYAFRGQTGIKKLIIPATVTSIGTGAFQNCVNLKEVEFEESGNWSLTSLGANAFQNCISLTTLTNMPSTLTSLGNYAFAGCKSLTTFVTPANVSSTGTNAFQNCTALTEVTFTRSSVTIGNYAFDGCTALTTIHIKGNVGNYAFNNCKKLANVTFKTSGITRFGTNAFQNCTALTSLEVPSSVTTYGNYVFSGSGLTSFTFTNAKATMGAYIFQNCTSLGSVNLPAELAAVPYGAFSHCSSLTSITLPETVTSIRTMAFEYSGLTSIVIPANVTTFDYFSSATATAASKWSYSNQVKTFQYCTELLSVTLPEGFTHLPGYSFLGCEKLATINGTENLTHVGNQAFAYSGVQTVDISKVTNLETEYASSLFEGCKELTDVVFNDNLTTMRSQYMFRYTEKLKTVKLPSALTIVYNGMFQEAYGLESIVIPKGVVEIDTGAFKGATALTSVTFAGDSIEVFDSSAFYGTTALKNFTIPDTVYKISYYAFQFSGLETIHLPTMLTDLGWDAFTGCPNLTAFSTTENHPVFRVEDGILFDKESNVLLHYPAGKPDDDGIYTVPEGVPYFDSHAFQGATAIKEIRFADANVAIECFYNQAFAYTNVEKVVIPEGVTELGQMVFEGAANLKEVIFPSTMTAFTMNSNFLDCVSLESIDLPKALTKIPDSTFKNTGLKSIVIPENVTTIAANAFAECKNLKTVYLPSSLLEIGSNAFQNSPVEKFYWYETDENGEMKIIAENALPDGVLTIGANAFQNTKITAMKLPETALTLGNYLFADCSKLESVTLPSNLPQLYTYMFQNCVKLTSVNIPKTVTSIPEYAFQNCAALTTVTIPASVTSIGKKTEANTPTNDITESKFKSYAFQGCTALETVVFEHAETDRLIIGAYSFSDCTALKNFVLPARTEIIGDYAFENCTSLTSMTFGANTTVMIGAYAFKNCTAITELVVPERVYQKGANIFSGWTNAQTIRFVASEFKVYGVWATDWMGGCNATLSYGYVPAVEETPEA